MATMVVDQPYATAAAPAAPAAPAPRRSRRGDVGKHGVLGSGTSSPAPARAHGGARTVRGALRVPPHEVATVAAAAAATAATAPAAAAASSTTVHRPTSNATTATAATGTGRIAQQRTLDESVHDLRPHRIEACGDIQGHPVQTWRLLAAAPLRVVLLLLTPAALGRPSAAA